MKLLKNRTLRFLTCWPVAAILLSANQAFAQPTAPEPPPPLEPWYEAFDLRAFVDAYGSINYNFPKPQTGPNATTRAYDTSNGFALAWAGFDVSYDADPVGGTVSLRWGPAAETYSSGCLSQGQVINPCDSEIGLEFVKQAYATWKPGGADSSVTLDFGKFDTIYGAEVAESHDNWNYTRGIVYWFAQPLFHTGLRANYQVVPELGLTALVVNGWNNTIDNNVGKTFGAQAALSLTDSLSLSLGWIGGPEQDDSIRVQCPEGTAYDPDQSGCAPRADTPAAEYDVDRGNADDPKAWKHLIDLVITFDVTDELGLMLNADYGVEGVREQNPDTLRTRVDQQSWYGGMLGVRYQLTETWAVAARGEYLGDPDGYATGTPGLALATGTLTLEATPTDNLILRLENRGDFALDADDEDAQAIFQKDIRDTSETVFTTTLGVVVTTN